MSKQKNLFDVWIVETNTVYKEVPYTVVTDWLQQGRLLEDDRAKPAGSPDWKRLGDVVELQAFLPRAEPHAADDQAEAMEPVGLDFTYSRPSPEEDEDVDMIPLIDVSLVLLVFFMLTASTVAMASQVNIPDAEHGILADLQADNEMGLHIDITRDDDGSPIFALRAGEKAPQEDERNLRSMRALLECLKARLARTTGPVELQINGDKQLKAKVGRDLAVALRVEPFRSRISETFYGVGRKEP